MSFSWQAARRLLALLLAAASCIYIAVFFFVAFARDPYPLQLEWLECGVLDATARVLAHNQIYVAPTHIFVPYIYTPLYYYVSAALASILGLHFSTLRALSTACTAGCFLLIFYLARRFSGGSRHAGLLAAGLFAALYAAADSWYDLARVDMLFLLLTLVAIAFSYRGHAIAAGVLFGCAFQAKQSALLIGVFVLAHEYRRLPKLVAGLGTLAVVAGGSSLLLNRISGGWYLYFTEFLPSHQGISLRGGAAFFGRDLLRYLLPALVLIAIHAAEMRKDRRTPPEIRRFLLFVSIGAFLSSFGARLHSGGSVNVVLPLYAWIAVLFGVSLAPSRAETSAADPQDETLHRRQAIALGAGLLQFLILAYWPGNYIPGPAAQREANAILDSLAKVPGNIYIFDNSADLLERGRTEFADTDAVYDLLRADSGPAAQALRSDLDTAFRRGEFAAIVSDRPAAAGMPYPAAPPEIMNEFGFASPLQAHPAVNISTVAPPPVAPRFIFYARPKPKPAAIFPAPAAK
jgi:hypothetical protein